MAFSPPPLKALEKAAALLDDAWLATGVWADDIRQEAERRLGIGPTDERAWDDPDYSTALDWVGVVSDLRNRAHQALANVPKESGHG